MKKERQRLSFFMSNPPEYPKSNFLFTFSRNIYIFPKIAKKYVQQVYSVNPSTASFIPSLKAYSKTISSDKLAY